MKYLKYFLTESDYNNYITGNEGEIHLPNVSYVVEGTNIYFNPISNKYTFSGVVKQLEDIPIGIVFMCEIESTNQIIWSIKTIENMKLIIDGNIIDNPKQYITNYNGILAFSYTFTDNNEHTFEIEVDELPNNYMTLFNSFVSLISIDLNNWDTSKITDMSQMFYQCNSLTSLDLSNWDISNVTNMNYMFDYCTSLSEVKMGGNPSKVTNVFGMFAGIDTNGKFYYNSAYDYSLILTKLPSTWTAVPCTMVDGVLIPN